MTTTIVKPTTIINAPENAVYVSEFMTTLPYGVLNKNETGCGATHLMLTNQVNTILIVPFVKLITNKQSKIKGIFNFSGGVKESEFAQYVTERKQSNELVYKIMVTFDSLPKLNNWLKKYNVDLDIFHYVVDEYQEILRAMSYRSKAINGLIDEVKHTSKVTFLSATPLPHFFSGDYINSLEYIELKWTCTKPVKIVRMKTTQPFLAVLNIIQDMKTDGYLEVGEHKAKEVMFFLNSVVNVKSIIEQAGLTNDNCKVVCADNQRNRNTLETIKISNPEDENKTFTFVTKSSFAGCDFESETAIPFVISNNRNKTTLLDINTDIKQIAGRIRTKTNPFKGMLVHIYNTCSTDMTQSEFDKVINDRTIDSIIAIDMYNNNDNVNWRRVFIERYHNEEDENMYVMYNDKDDIMEFNEMQKLAQRYEFEQVLDVYTNGLKIRDSYLKAGFNVDADQIYLQLEGSIKKASTRSFKQLAKQYVDRIEYLLEMNVSVDDTQYDLALNLNLFNQDELDKWEKVQMVKSMEQEESLLKQVRVNLGIDSFSKAAYSKEWLKSELTNKSSNVMFACFNEISKIVKIGQFYSSKVLKTELQRIYEELQIGNKVKGKLVVKTAKATDIADWFETEECSKRIDNVKTTGMQILTSKYRKM